MPVANPPGLSPDDRRREEFAENPELRREFFVRHSYDALSRRFEDESPEVLIQAAEVKADLLERVYEQGDLPFEEIEKTTQHILEILDLHAR
jgi:hypothetical protein